MAKKILIIEDHPATVEMIRILLEVEGFEIAVAYNGKSGIEKVSSEKPDLILLDVMMPEISGLDVCRKLKDKEETKKIPVVIVSIKASEENVKAGMEAGANDYIGKPFDPRKLIETINKYI
ncbi:MAG: response regulator [Candidatus Saganbacteria bacterium]|nr:response regulator [Candidatus Saganbacteria bacterium]